MDISKLKISLGLVVAILLQAGGFVWFISELNATVQHNQLQIESLIEDTEEKLDAIQEIETRIKVIENEMRTIMSDHEGFGDTLQELGKAGIIPSGEKRKYGDY
tara:strand:+ start:511 stop:822 length:312 start_codon:yes stop_codon:yes gene_type:complete